MNISIKFLSYNITVLFLFFLFNSFTPIRDTIKKDTFRFSTIVIDPGHGGKDPGAHGAYSVEKNVALSIGKKLKKAINDSIPGINVIMTRTDDTFIELNRRSAIANENHANLFISIHCNSSPEGTAERAHKQIGALVLVYGYHRKEEQLEATELFRRRHLHFYYFAGAMKYNPKQPKSPGLLISFLRMAM